ncbi:uncharacterized protein BX663DRAFT_483534 [Cokeromyces recurvatus]|uniref:uncharacterized protein n=1 Tax=Cokeromyces recurvatus TaxID=90255 RepID=UPI0022209A68|nr:uncharacterized protein BX663DRAFT_483534 [Cokeromyces recurvatus]KAI7905850.1 hypothetical protein BX663DRAFT_483534 [Cokeromyces recurvatus]
MDPFRNNPFGFRPPAPPPTASQPPPPTTATATATVTATATSISPPGVYGQPRGPTANVSAVRPPPFIGSPQTGSASPVNTTSPDNEKLNTLFVGAIAAGITDEWLETLLKTCGNLLHWKRTKDPSGNPKGFGFATYADPDSVLCALRVLGGETTNGVVLKAQDGSGIEKKLIVKADDNVHKHLEGHQQQHQSSQDQEQLKVADQEKYAIVQKYVQAITMGQDANVNNVDVIHRESAYSKDRNSQREQRTHDSHNQERYGERRESNERSSRREYGFVKGPTEYYSHSVQQDLVTDEEIERKRREKHERDVENAYRQREKRFEAREYDKLYEYKKDVKREIELEERESKEKEYWLERLGNWDDEVEMAKGEEPYYSDRSRWRRMREIQRRREDERDEEDRRREIQEIEEERQRQEEEEKHMRDNGYLNREGDEGKIALKPKKLNFNIPIKRNTLGGVDDDEEEEAKKKRRVLVPLDYGDIEETKEELSAEKRAKRVKELIDSIPSSQHDLWAYTVKWDEVDEELINSKLHPFVSKKIVDLLGMEEEDLVNYVLQLVKDRKTPDELVSELEGALDEDALVFVMKLWRALIFETERKHQKL